jgi:hypothetical protein
MKNILPYESTSKAIKNYDDSAIAKKENLDVKTDKEHMVHHLKCKNLQKIEHK